MRFHVVLFHVMPPYLSTIATCHSITTISLSQELTIFTYYSSSILVPPYDITWVNVSRFKWTGYQIDLAIVTGSTDPAGSNGHAYERLWFLHESHTQHTVVHFMQQYYWWDDGALHPIFLFSWFGNISHLWA